MTDGTHPGGAPSGPVASTDGALVEALVRWNVRARSAAPDEAARCDRAAETAWVALVREAHDTGLSYVHVHLVYNRVLLSLRRPPSDPERLAEPAVPDPDDELGRALARPDLCAAPYELTREFFARLRARTRPWRDEGDERFHRYLARCSKWLAVAYKRETGLLPPRAPAAPAPRGAGAPDGRRVRTVLLDALATPEVLVELAAARWLPTGVRDVLRRQLAASSAAGLARDATQGSPAARSGATTTTTPVPPRLLRPALADALDQLAASSGFVPPLEPTVEDLVSPLLRTRAGWERPWAAWCAARPPDAVRALARALLRDLVRGEEDEAPGDAHRAARRDALSGAPCDAPCDAPTPRLAAAACEHALPTALARYARAVGAGHATAVALGDALERDLVADAGAGLTGAQIAAKRGITPALVYKRLERLRRRVVSHLTRTAPAAAASPTRHPFRETLDA